MRDVATGVMDIFITAGNAVGLTPLLNDDGKPEVFISSNKKTRILCDVPIVVDLRIS